jgi:hypothetical protein
MKTLYEVKLRTKSNFTGLGGRDCIVVATTPEKAIECAKASYTNSQLYLYNYDFEFVSETCTKIGYVDYVAED